MEKIDYSFITEEKLEKDGKSSYTKLLEESVDFGAFKIGCDEYAVLERLQKEHKKCRIKENGTSKFGAIGGGAVVTYHFDGDGNSDVLYKCDGCDEVFNVTRLAKENKDELDEETMNRFNERNVDAMGIVEYARCKKFIADNHKDGQTLDISFEYTGLGPIVKISCEEAGVYADVTDYDAW